MKKNVSISQINIIQDTQTESETFGNENKSKVSNEFSEPNNMSPNKSNCPEKCSNVIIEINEPALPNNFSKNSPSAHKEIKKNFILSDKEISSILIKVKFSIIKF
jgi:hypothetical protein